MPARILVVDDEPGIRSLFTRVVGGIGHEVVAVSSGEEALVRFRERDYDIVFCDLMLTGMNGFELIRSILELRPGQPVAIMTGYPARNVESGARLFGAFVFLPKPFHLRQIEAAIAAALSRRR